MSKFSDLMKSIETEAKLQGPEAMAQLEQLRSSFRGLAADVSSLLKEKRRAEFSDMVIAIDADGPLPTSVLAMGEIPANTSVSIICAECEKLSPPSEDEDDVIDLAVDAGWQVEGNDDFDTDLCPECQ